MPIQRRSIIPIQAANNYLDLLRKAYQDDHYILAHHSSLAAIDTHKLITSPHTIFPSESRFMTGIIIAQYLSGVNRKRHSVSDLVSEMLWRKASVSASAYADRCFVLNERYLRISRYQYIPPIPPAGIAGAGFSSLMSATRLSVVSTIEATEAAFWSALLVTFVGSTMPAGIISVYTSL